MYTLLKTIVENPEWHARWLNTLSYLELCGARKISQFLPRSLHESSTWEERSELLQHASEEFRHAQTFCKLIERLEFPKSHTITHFCGRRGLRYLDLLDLNVARLLRAQNYQADFRKACYLLTTYAIEKRAEELYACYEEILRQADSKISVRFIINEERGHLAQIERDIDQDPVISRLCASARRCEEEIFQQFWGELEQEISLTPAPSLASLLAGQNVPSSDTGVFHEDGCTSSCA